MTIHQIYIMRHQMKHGETSNNKCMGGKISDIAYVDDNTSNIDDQTSDKAW